MNFQQPPANVFTFMGAPMGGTPMGTPCGTPMGTPPVVYMTESPAQAFYLVPCMPMMPPMPTEFPMYHPGYMNSPTPCAADFNSAHPLSPVSSMKSSIPPGFCATQVANQTPAVPTLAKKPATRKEKRRARKEKSK